MGKSKNTALARLPKDQKCNFFVGPVSSWFVPNATDIWTRDDRVDDHRSGHFIYGSIGCFCYGPILTKDDDSEQSRSISALMTNLIDIKDDNSRVTCIRFARDSDFPLAMILTESGSLLVHDCHTNNTLIRFKKSEILAKVDINSDPCSISEPPHKKSRLNLAQQVSSLLWPHREHCFLGVSLPKEKTNLLIWVKLKDIALMISNSQAIDKNDFIISHERVDLLLSQYSSPICCMQSIMLDSNRCLIAIALDEGLISVVEICLNGGSSSRVMRLPRHNDQICSMSFFVGSTKKFPSGLLASASRDGLVLVWDIENQFYFADYQASPVTARSNSNINWFSLQMVPYKNSTYLLVSNIESGLTSLPIPENTKSKIRMKEVKAKAKGNPPKPNGDQNIRHHALIFNLAFDPLSGIVVTSSLDGNHIFWDVQNPANQGSQQKDCLEAQPKYLLPSMPNNSRSHMLRHSPIKEELMGAALGKAGLRFYTIGEKPENYKFNMTSSCSHIVRKITKASMCPTSLCWHPNQEYRVAIGTLEGKVVQADLTHPQAILIVADQPPQVTKPVEKKRDIVDAATGVDYNPIDYQDVTPDTAVKRKFNGPHMDGVYSICWGPNPTCLSDTSRLSIYAVNSISHRLCIYVGKKERSDKLSNYLDEIPRERIFPEAFDRASEVSWKSTLDLMALGTIEGKIVIASYRGDQSESETLFKLLFIIDGPMGSAFVQCLAWHSTTDQDDVRYYYLAASANETPVFLFDLRGRIKLVGSKDRQILESGDDSESKTNVLSSYICQLNGHTKAVSDVAWCPHNPDMLASSSFDKTCIVWSIHREASEKSVDTAIRPHIMAKFSARDRLFTVEWSLVKSDLLYTSGHDSTIWAWRPSENPYLLQIDDCETKKQDISSSNLEIPSKSR